MLLRVLACLLFLVVGVSHALADRRVALVVANENYKASRLSNPINDSKIIGPALEHIGFDVTTVTDIADISGFASTIREFTEKADGADVALFYYAGHGFAVNNTDDVGSTNYLMTTSADLSSNDELVLKSGGIALDDIVQKISRVSKVALFFIDACRNDPYEGQRSTAGTRSLGRIDQTANEVFIVSSTRLGTTASDSHEQIGTPFARSLALHIQEPSLRVEDIVSRVRVDVEKATNATQSPEIVKHDLDEPLVLVASLPETPVPAQPVTTAPCMLLVEPDASAARLRLLSTGEAKLACRQAVTENPENAELRKLLAIVTEQDDARAALLSRDPGVVQGYLDAYATGTYAAAVREHLAALTPEAPVTPKPDAAYDPVELATLVQQELDRAGCRPGGADGQWGKRSVAAADLFVRQRGLKLATAAPTEELLLALQATSGRVCPEPKVTVEVADCKEGQKRNSKGICYTPETTKKAATKKATTKKSTGGTTVTARPRTNCFEFNGETFCE